MTGPCGCCEGPHSPAPSRASNPPGSDALEYRVGTHGTFLAAMLARLTTHQLPGDGPARRPLQRLTARTTSDPSIALLDAWATIGDILTFYQEQIANEGFLYTATERRSLIELGRLLGYELRPAISSTAFLAFTLAKDDPASAQGVTIGKGTRAQSLPPSGGLPASFETSEDLFARPDWSELKPRTQQPQRMDAVRASFTKAVVLEGAIATLATGDLLLFEFSNPGEVVRRIATVTIDRPPLGASVTSGHGQPTTTVTLVPPALAERCELLGNFLDAAKAHAPTDELAKRVSDIASHVLDVPNEPNEPGSDHDRIRALSNLIRKAARELRSSLGEGSHARPRSHGAGSDGDAARAWVLGVLRLLAEADPTPGLATAGGVPGKAVSDPIGEKLAALAEPLTRSPSATPASSTALGRDPAKLFGAGGDLFAQLLSVARPELAGNLHKALGGAALTPRGPLKALYGLARHAQPFGAMAPRAPRYKGGVLIGTHEWMLDGSASGIESPGGPPHGREVVALDGKYPAVMADSWAILEGPTVDPDKIDQHDPGPAAVSTRLRPVRIQSVATRGVAGYNMASSVTALGVDEEWLNFGFDAERHLSEVRHTTIHLEAQPLTLAPEPILDDVEGDSILLDQVQDGLLSGRRFIVTGERTDIPGVGGVNGGEAVMLAAATQHVDMTLPGDTAHTVLELATPLSYSYLRSSVKIWGNVAKSTQGETHAEVLGGGDPTQPLQRFRLSLGPLSNLAAADARGAQDTLEVRVDGVLWHETDDLMATVTGDRKFLVRTDDDGATSASFGGGARLPSGPDNVRATYRVGSGAGGNVPDGKISQLLTRPLGVRDVVNPLAATGGAERENVASARRSVPLSVMAVDRLVSVRDYGDFARARAGIGKAQATRITDGREEVVYVTVTGADDGPVDPSSDLVVALRDALVSLGDPSLPLAVGVRELRFVVVAAGVRVQPDYLWAEVEGRLRAALLAELGFDRRELGEPVVLSKVVAAAQRVAGVDAVAVHGFALVPEEITPAGLRALTALLAEAPPDRLSVERARRVGHVLRPDQLAVLSPRLPDTLILHEGLR